MKIVFFTIISDSHYAGCRTDDFIKSFKHFHPDIELVVFREQEISETFAENPQLNFYNCKAHFANLFYKWHIHKNDIIVNIDADHLIFARLDEILQGNYEVAAPANFNVVENAKITIDTVSSTRGVIGACQLVANETFVQGGLIAGRERFWRDYNYASLKWSSQLGHKENDVLNLLWHLLPYEKKILDGDYDYHSDNFNCYYGCASLGRESQFGMNEDKVMLNGKQVKAYHFARGGSSKPHPKDLFSAEVNDFINNILK